MVRRRWRFFTIAAFLVFLIKDAICQDENDFYYTPIEKNFAQVQPPLFPSRPPTFYEHGDSFRVPQPQQPLYSDGYVRFPSPNYNQNPSPFQLPTGRSQSGGQYYVNQPDYTPQQRQKYRPALPHNYQIVHPASTKRPNVSQIHSIAYQNDPSKPETFLGQITINNPDIDYLQNTRFKNIPFDGNSLKSNGQSGHITRDEDIDNDNQDLFDVHRVTTYNPNKITPKIKPNVKQNSARFTKYDIPEFEEENTELGNGPGKLFTRNNNLRQPNSESSPYHASSTEYKGLLDLEPLLEEDISDISTFRELMKNTQGSFDVQVIKSNNSKLADIPDDSKPDASSMNEGNVPKDATIKMLSELHNPPTSSVPSTTQTVYEHSHEENSGEEALGDSDYEDVYYDEPESTEVQHTTKPPQHINKHTETTTSNIYDEYDTTDEPENTTYETNTNVTESFDVLVMKPDNNTMVKDDNFKQFVDTPLIDQTESISNNDTTVNNNMTSSEEDFRSIETPSILGQEVVSVVTTKSVVNGTISVQDVTYAPSTKKISAITETTFMAENNNNDTSIPVTTENWVVVASVQTSRSVSGARFLPFPTVEQEEKKQVLTDEKDDNDGSVEEGGDSITQDPREQVSGLITSSSTENINDKLDSIQSELSSAVLSGSLDKANKNIELITEATTEPTTTTSTTTTTSLNIFTLKSTQAPVTTERSAPEPLPVMIKKFTPRVTTSTTPKPRKKPSLVTVMDDLTGLLPPGYKPRLSYKDKRTSTTTTTTTRAPTSTTEEPIVNNTQGRSSGISSKNKVILLDIKSLRPKEYKPKENKPQENKPQDEGSKHVPNDELSKLLPPGYKLPTSEESTSKESSKLDILDKVQKVDISAFLPKDFKLNSSTNTPKKELPVKATPVDISALLPPGFKLNKTDNEKGDNLLGSIKIADVSNLLPPGFKLNNSEETTAPSSTTKAPGGIKLVFPSRPGSKPVRKTTPRPIGESGPSPVTPKIQKGWPTRASTEFTGWPTPSTTPFSIEKLLEAQRNATATSPSPELSTEPTTRRVVSTTTTTPAPPPSTTPGVCRKECDIAATIKIVSGVTWVPELLDHHTEEWQRLAEEVKQELNSVYSKSNLLSKWYKGIRIDGFSKGSVLVDYFIELNDVEKRVDTLELKKLFHKSLHEAKPGSVMESVPEESQELDPDVMLGDQPDEERMKKSNEKMTKTIDKSAGKLEIGKFVMDPAYTEFIVLPKREEPTLVVPEEESFLPQWGIAVIVIAMASLLFVIIFGVTVLVNRQKSSKAKQPIPLSEDMLRELDKSHMGGFDDMHQMKERDLPYLPPGKRMSTAFIEQLAFPTPGDSWRSEWTPQLQKYMQHYTPDSGRGSQIYGAGGNAYGYGGGSQIYGQTGGSQVYGYTGEYPRSHNSRRRSDYDTNF
ncbi:mucin-5AC [Leguminivora glycinivorella]|uniref:mucin-5AC n=1 Tax=Leguminivora glycinivorella TaxID=1035111 RepID=UPI00200EB780|nr:mucin-5AC [Leguminivora glycinivorella]